MEALYEEDIPSYLFQFFSIIRGILRIELSKDLI